MKKIILSLFVASILSSCALESTPYIPTFYINENFNTSIEGWKGDFADYPVGEENFYELKYSQDKLPMPLDTTKKALRISGNNHSDDLFMFLSRKYSGLKANQKYTISFEVELASNAPSNAMGVGGAPGESVYFGLGFTAIEPKKVLDSTSKHYTMNIKKMQQATNGDDMKVYGNIANGTDKSEYKLIRKTGVATGKTDANGNLWLILGTDSGFEATTTLYYTRLAATVQEVSGNI